MSVVGGEPAKGRPSKLGRYELITQIGHGGMAEVQLALQKGPAGFEKLVVVKLVHANLATQKTFVDMLLDEARVAALVKHPNVVDIYDLGEADGRYFIAMEYLEGEPLLAVLRAGREGKRLDPLSTARLIADTAEGLDAAHELRSMAGDPIELVHHDVSLGNIVVLYNGQVKLVDFGVAKATMSAAAPTKIQGKFSYMAPEKLKGGSGDRRSDIWSLGCVLWEALTLRRLFKGGNDADTMKQVIEQKIPAPSTVNGDVIADFDPIVMRALERDPNHRYATAKAMSQDLEEVLRKQGYGGRNDQIARYMQATFESHISARKKLLQEVSSKGRASAAVLEAAFTDQTAVPTLTTSGEFSIAFKAPVAEGTPAGATSNARAVARTLPPPKREAYAIPDNEATAIDAPRITDEQIAALMGGPSIAEGTSVDTPVAPPRPSGQLAQHKRLYLGLAAIGAVLVLVIIVAVVVATRGGGGSPAADAAVAKVEPDAEQVAIAADAMVAVADAEIVIEIEDAPTRRAADAAIARPPADARKVVVIPDPPPPKQTAAELTQNGLRELASGKFGAAAQLFRKATMTDPRHAAAWRGLGVTYEKVRANGQAITAFQRYLALAPGAGDAAAIKDRIDKLKPPAPPPP